MEETWKEKFGFTTRLIAKEYFIWYEIVCTFLKMLNVTNWHYILSFENQNVLFLRDIRPLQNSDFLKKKLYKLCYNAAKYIYT